MKGIFTMGYYMTSWMTTMIKPKIPKCDETKCKDEVQSLIKDFGPMNLKHEDHFLHFSKKNFTRMFKKKEKRK